MRAYREARGVENRLLKLAGGAGDAIWIAKIVRDFFYFLKIVPCSRSPALRAVTFNAVLHRLVLAPHNMNRNVAAKSRLVHMRIMTVISLMFCGVGLAAAEVNRSGLIGGSNS
jgi:hypothetical protein